MPVFLNNWWTCIESDHPLHHSEQGAILLPEAVILSYTANCKLYYTNYVYLLTKEITEYDDISMF